MINKINNWFAKNKNLGVLALRLAMGLFFLGNGIYKWQNIQMMTGFFSQVGLGAFWVYVVAASETISGLLMLLGIFLWIPAALVTIIMAVAIYLGTGPNSQGQPFILHYISSWGPNLVYAAAAVCLAFCGSRQKEQA